MQKYILPVIIALAVAIWAVSTAEVQADPATVTKGQGCNLLDASGTGLIPTTNDQTVVTQSSNGNAKLTCKISGVPNPTGAAIHWDFSNTGFTCNMPAGGLAGGIVMDPGGTTSHWHEVISSNGVATLQCFVP